MDDVRGDFLGPPNGTTPAAVIAIFFSKYHKKLHLKENARWSNSDKHFFFAVIANKI